MRRVLPVVALLGVFGCGEPVVDFATGEDGGGIGQVTGGGGSGGTGSGGAAGVGGNQQAADEFPCEVRNLLTSKCTSCHGTPLTGAAPYPLQTRAQLASQSPAYPGQTLAQRSLVRMQNSAAPMPPAPAALPTAAELTAFGAWIDAGMPGGSCGAATTDGGTTTQDAGPAPTTCTSGSMWLLGDRGSASMHPGEACVACHRVNEPFRAYFFMGTAFPSAHERDNCNANPPATIVVDILNADGGVVYSMNVRQPSGNFYRSSLSAGMAMPYRARIRNTATGRSLEMMTPQTNGDCNTCHAEQGVSGSAGRIVWPQ